jgi:hypothetical protein
MIAWSRSPMARSGSGIAAIAASTAVVLFGTLVVDYLLIFHL